MPDDADPNAVDADDVPAGDLLGLLSFSEAAAVLRTTERHLRRLQTEGRVPFTKIGGRIRFRLQDLERWVEDNTHYPI